MNEFIETIINEIESVEHKLRDIRYHVEELKDDIVKIQERDWAAEVVLGNSLDLIVAKDKEKRGQHATKVSLP
jgi:hypothetical protein